MRNRRSLTPSEKALWQHYVKDLKPLAKRQVAEDATTEKSIPRKPSLAPRSAGVPTAVRATKKAHVSQAAVLPGEIDRNARRKLKRGRSVVDARLDLHGFQAVQAQHRLGRFIEDSRERGYRCVLVITGKGANSREQMFATGGTLRRLVPEWLRQSPLSHHVVSFGSAERRHGGEGALYVMLRSKQ